MNHAHRRLFVAAISLASILAPTAANAASVVKLLPGEIDRKVSEVAQGQAPSGNTLVAPGRDANWAFTDEGLGGPVRTSANSYQGYGLAPQGAPAGVGAFHQRIGVGSNSDKLIYGTHQFAGRALGSISSLSYWTYVSPNGPATNLAPSLNLVLDLNGDGIYSGNSTDDTLVFEPIYQNASRTMLDPADSTAAQCGNPCVLDATWQKWDARAGRWVSRRGDGNTTWNGINFESIEHYLSRYPSARIASNPASVSFRSGSGWSNVESFVDALTVDGTTFDFEPTVESVTPLTPTWRYETVGGSAEYLAKWSDNGSHQGVVDNASFTGTGSLQQVIGTVGHADHVSYGTPIFAGTRLDELTDLSYATYLEPGSSLRPPVLSLRLDLNGDGIWQNNTVDDTLQFQPSEQETPAVTGAWQFWSTLGGEWYSRKNLQRTSFTDYLAANQNAQIGGSDASLLVLLGSGYSNVRSLVDSVSINGRLLDFEPVTKTVTPADGAGGWFFNPPLDQSGAENNRQALVNGISQPPAGVGSLSQRATTTKMTAVTPLFAGKRLRDLTSLSYWTYRASSGAQMPALKIHLDLDGDQIYSSSATDTVLVFEPVYQSSSYVTPGQPAVATGVWQRWNALEGGWWVGSGSVTTPGGCVTGNGGPGVCKLEQLIKTPVPGDPSKTFGDLTVALGPSSIDIQTSAVGAPDVYADRLNVNGITFDFEAAVPSRLPTQLDGNRSSNEGYDLVAMDSSPEQGTANVEIYASCSETDLYLYVESANAAVTASSLLFDVNGNDKFDNVQDRAAASGAGVMTTQGAPIAGSEVRASYDGTALELRLPRTFTGGGWFQYDVTTDTGRNTGWGTLNTADAKRFIPDPCVYTPVVVNGSVPVDCDRTSNDLRLIQHLLDRGLGNSIKLSGTCSVSATAPHGGDQVKIAAAGLILERNGTTLESLDPYRKARIQGSGSQAAIYVAPGTRNATVRSLWIQGVSRGIVVHNTINTTVGHRPAGLQTLSVLGNRIIGVADLHEGILAVAASNGMNSTATSISVQHGDIQGSSRTYAIPLSGDQTTPGHDLVNVEVVGNYISYAPPGPLTPTADVTGVVVRQNGSGRDVWGATVDQNAIGMASSDFPSFNYAGIRVHSDSNDPFFTHIDDVSVFRNSLGRLEELNLAEIDPSLPDAGDLHATGRTGIAIGRVSNFVVQGNSIRTILSTVPGVNMIGGGIVVYDSRHGLIETNSVITIAGANTEDEDLGAIGIFDDLMNVFSAGGASGKPTFDIEVVSNYAGWARAGASDIGTQRGLVVNGASAIKATLNQFKKTSAKSILVSVPIAGSGATLGGAETLPAKPVMDSTFCKNWFDTYSGSGQPQDSPLSEFEFGGRTNGSRGNQMPSGNLFSGNTSC